VSELDTGARRRLASVTARHTPTASGRFITYFDRAPSPVARYAFAIGITLAAWLLTLALQSHLTRVIFVLFWPAVLLAALFGGFGPALVASLLSTILVDWSIVGRSEGVRSPTLADVAPLVAFLGASLLVSAVANALRTARRHAERAGDELRQIALEIDSQAMQLEQQAAELEHQLEESQALQEEVEQTSAELSERTAQAEEADSFSRGILASIADPFVVQDREWRFRYINEKAAEIFFRSRHGKREELIGRVVWEEFPHVIGSETERQMRRAVREQVPVTFEAYSTETATWSVISCYPLPDGGLALQWQDITARRRAEETARYLARASEVLGSSLDYETTLQELAQIVVPELAEWCSVHVVGDDGKPHQIALAHVDPKQVKWAEELNRRYPAPPDAQRGVPNVLRTGEPELYPEITDEMLLAGARDEEHKRIILTLGLRSAMIVPLVARGRVLGALSLLSVRTGRRYGPDDLALASEIARRAALAVDNALLHRAERVARQAADEANTAKMQFLAVMSHELRTPLNAIGGYTELLRLGLRGPVTPEQIQDLDRISLNQRNLLGIINDILNFAKVEAGHVEFNLGNVRVVPLVADLESVVAPQLRAASLTLHQPTCDKELAVYGDEEKIRQIILNLLSNAIKFSTPGGTISIDCAPEESRVRIDVRDTGIGIARERLQAVFDPFVQLDRTLASRHVGTGLGLSISRDLARAMGGDISAVSEPGKGSTFTLTLPPARKE
jgi:signal transduction histidine kinase/PAS domain-containing protein